MSSTSVIPVDDPAQRSAFSTKNISYNSYKEQSRDMLLEILNEHQENRKAVLLRELKKEAKVAASWDYKETKAREERQRKLLSRLSKPRKCYSGAEADEAVDKIRQKIEAAEQRANGAIRCRKEATELDLAKERVEKKNEMVMKEQELVVQNYETKQRKLEESLSRVADERMLKFRLKKERREKQILKSKIQIILANLSKRSCHRFTKDYERFATAQQKDNVEHGKENTENQLYDSIMAIRIKVQQENDNTPNSVLTRSLTKKEIELIKEDPNFFVSNKEIRSKLPIFYGFSAETERKIQGNAEESVYRSQAFGMNASKSIRAKSNDQSIAHNQSQDEIQEKNREKRQRQLENYAEMQRIRETKRLAMQKRMNEKEDLIRQNAERRLLERKQLITKQREEEVTRFTNSTFKRLVLLML
eukprot:TRINITY_DN9627_c0_g6_i3.p1 TRINITY_DN9627_c0_g6~~TRINITY_DN9627_c0_g6_i3.p1  ORF type:complete len:418 (-),score=149.55 TRINITY_DN9627_c0_g6_i3:233-1486(-)